MVQTTIKTFTVLFVLLFTIPSWGADPVQINHGIIKQNYDSSPGVAPLEIITKAGSNYYIKVVNITNNQETLTAYIRGGRPFEVDIPIGTYQIKYATGNIWYGEEDDFGSEAFYFKADELFPFTSTSTSTSTSTEYQYSGYTIELILKKRGNLDKKRISKLEFDRN